jgi:hypothetical protein
MGLDNSLTASIFVKPVLNFFLKTPYQGSLTTVYLSLAPALQGVTGKYFRYGICRPCLITFIVSTSYLLLLIFKLPNIYFIGSDCKETQVAPEAESKENALRLWLTSLKWTKASFPA